MRSLHDVHEMNGKGLAMFVCPAARIIKFENHWTDLN
jgi:hypothetical protein